MTTSLIDRVVRWNLDADGTIYGDERERLRWYEGITTAASLQWLAIPWASTVLVWALGRTAVLPLTVVMVVLFLPMLLCTVYVRSQRVDTAVRSWTPRRIVMGIVGGLPFVLFLIGCLHAVDADSSVWRGAAVGAAFGALVAGVASVAQTRKRRREEAAAGDED